MKSNTPTIDALLKHLFRDNYENSIILDYLTLLVREPHHKLPVLLLNGEPNSGKSTFLYMLSKLFKRDYSEILPSSIHHPYNSYWAERTIVGIEDFKTSKQAWETIKNYNTCHSIKVEQKMKMAKEVHSRLHFVITTQGTKIPDYASDFVWVVPTKRIEPKLNFHQQILKEIPAFKVFIISRGLINERESRLYFNVNNLNYFQQC